MSRSSSANSPTMVRTGASSSNSSRTFGEVIRCQPQMKRELLFVLRALEVLLSSGVGLEAGVHMIAKGGYGAVSEDFSKIIRSWNRSHPRGRAEGGQEASRQ